VRELVRRIAQIYRRVAGTDVGSHPLAAEERRTIRDRILEANDGGRDQAHARVASGRGLLAGLKDELPMSESGAVQKSAGSESESYISDLRPTAQQTSKQLTDYVCGH
jgi:hypothetical protein